MPQRSRSRSRTPGYAVGFPMSASGVLASLDFDFQNGRYYQSGQGVDPLVLTTTSRASVGYANSLAGVWSSFLSNVPRITNKGLLVEEARTNNIRNNSMQGAVAGTPGTAPTNWTIATFAGVAVSVIGTGVEDGVDYIDIRWNGTAGSTVAGGRIVIFESDTQVVAANGQTWSGSTFARLVGGALVGVILLRGVYERNAAGANLGSSTEGLITAGSSWNYGTTTRTNTNALAAFENTAIAVNWSNGTVVNFTLRIGWPQLELGSFATSPIRTTGAAATRAADVVTVTTPPAFGSAYTLFSRAIPNAPATYVTNQVALGVNNGTANERSRIRRVAVTGIGQGVVTDGGVDTVVASGMVSAQSVSRKIAFAIAAADQALSQDGAATVAGASTLPSTPTIITIGTDQSTTLSYNGYIERIALWPTTRLLNTDLQRITR